MADHSQSVSTNTDTLPDHTFASCSRAQFLSPLHGRQNAKRASRTKLTFSYTSSSSTSSNT